MMNIQNNFSKMAKQQGITMIVVLVVLLVLTIISVSAIDSNNLQSLMARNKQFRLEVFNATNTEIEAQFDFYNTQSAGAPVLPIDYLLKSGISSTIDLSSTTSSGASLLEEKSVNPAFDKEMSLTYTGGCMNTGTRIDFNRGGSPGSGGIKQCFQLQLDSSAGYENPKIQSEQVQTLALYQLF